MTRLKASLLLAALAIILYSNSLSGAFLWDDDSFVVNNTALETPENIVSFFTDPRTVAAGGLANDVYRPLSTLSFAVDHWFWKLNVFGYHLSNAILHALNAVAVFLLLGLLFGDLFIPFLASVIFVVHPVHTEAVAWISGRSNLLFLFWYLLSFICYIRYTRSGKGSFFAASLLSCTAALFSKEMAVTLPILLAAYDIHFQVPEAWHKRVMRYLPYAALVVTFLSIRTLLLGAFSQTGWWGDSAYVTFLTMLRVVADYIKTLIAPLKLCAAFYLVPTSSSIMERGVILSAAAIAAVIAAALVAYRRHRAVSFFIWWFFITLFPVTNIVPLKALEAERFLYLPSIGFCALLAIGAHALYEGGLRRSRAWGAVAIVCIAVVIGAYAVRTVIRNEDWNDGVTLSRKSIAAAPMNAWAMTSLGIYLNEHGHSREARDILERSAAILPEFQLTHNALGDCYLKMGEYEKAIGAYKEAFRLQPDLAGTRNRIGVCYANLKRYDEAKREFELALKLEPAAAVNAYLNLGRLYEMKNDLPEAIAQYRMLAQSARYWRDATIAYMRIGDTYAAMGQKEKAIEAYGEAIDICGRRNEDLRDLVAGKIRKLQ